MDRLSILQKNVQSLIDKYISLEQENSALRVQIEQQKQDNLKMYSEINELRNTCKRFEAVNALLGDTRERANLKQYINKLIKKLDRALSVLKM